jgi:2-hydroxychromene-2-carboxylate isomerase
MADVEFFFDNSCPWTYMAFMRLRETAARTVSKIVWRPIRVDRVRRAVNLDCADSRDDPEPRRARYQFKDLQDWAEFCNLKIQQPPDTNLALSGTILGAGAELIVKYSDTIFRAYFADGQDISQIDVVAGIARAVGLVDFAERLVEPEPAAELRANEAELLERGGFGSPTMFVGDTMFFGNDRTALMVCPGAGQRSQVRHAGPA